MDNISTDIRTLFATSVALKEEEIFGENLTLSAVMQRSEKLHNSVDLMEAFARIANGVKRDYGVKIRLPAFPLETPISDVLASFLAEVEKAAPSTAPQATTAANP